MYSSQTIRNRSHVTMQSIFYLIAEWGKGSGKLHIRSCRTNIVIDPPAIHCMSNIAIAMPS